MLGLTFFGDTDLAAVAIWGFWIFFAGLVVDLQRENMREGYPLEEEATGHLFQNTGPLGTSHIKRFRLPFGRGFSETPTKGREPVNVPGALFSLGDGHARQGEGETCGVAVECAMDTVLVLDLIKGRPPTAATGSADHP